MPACSFATRESLHPIELLNDPCWQCPCAHPAADIKFLTADKAFTPKGLKDDTPYTVMFGADKCGDTNKVGAGRRRGWAFERLSAVFG